MNTLIDKIGNYTLDYRGLIDSNGSINGNKLVEKQLELALKIIKNEIKPSKEEKAQFINFFINISGYRIKDLSSYLGIDQANISQWRNGKQAVSTASWHYVRLFFRHLFENKNTVTDDFYISNYKQVS